MRLRVLPRRRAVPRVFPRGRVPARGGGDVRDARLDHLGRLRPDLPRTVPPVDRPPAFLEFIANFTDRAFLGVLTRRRRFIRFIATAGGRRCFVPVASPPAATTATTRPPLFRTASPRRCSTGSPAAAPRSDRPNSSPVSSRMSRASWGSKEAGSVAVGSRSSQAGIAISTSAMTVSVNSIGLSTTGAVATRLRPLVAAVRDAAGWGGGGGGAMPKSPANCSQARRAGRRAGRTAFAAGLNAEGGGNAAGGGTLSHPPSPYFSPFRTTSLTAGVSVTPGFRLRLFGGRFRPEVTSQ